MRKIFGLGALVLGLSLGLGSCDTKIEENPNKILQGVVWKKEHVPEKKYLAIKQGRYENQKPLSDIGPLVYIHGEDFIFSVVLAYYDNGISNKKFYVDKPLFDKTAIGDNFVIDDAYTNYDGNNSVRLPTKAELEKCMKTSPETLGSSETFSFTGIECDLTK